MEAGRVKSPCEGCKRRETCDTPCDAYACAFPRRWRRVQQVLGKDGAGLPICIDEDARGTPSAIYEIRDRGADRAVFCGTARRCAMFLTMTQTDFYKARGTGTAEYDIVRLGRVYEVYDRRTGKFVCSGDRDEAAAALNMTRGSVHVMVSKSRRGEGKYFVVEGWARRDAQV